MYFKLCERYHETGEIQNLYCVSTKKAFCVTIGLRGGSMAFAGCFRCLAPEQAEWGTALVETAEVEGDIQPPKVLNIGIGHYFNTVRERRKIVPDIDAGQCPFV
jgi:hypothetical protein